METLVVDNGSSDDTCKLVRLLFPWAQLITGHGNIGFASGNNLGLKAAQGRNFLILNPDTEIYPGTLKTLLDYADANINVGMIGPHLINMDGSLQHSTFRFPNIRQAAYGFFEKLVPVNSVENGRYHHEAYRIEREVDHILGAAMLVKRHLWTQIGGFDDKYALYFEETDWCYRARQAGWKLAYIPTPTIMHYGAHTTSTSPERSSVLFARSQARFYRKNLGLFNYLVLKAIAFFGLLYWFARSSATLLRGQITLAIFVRRVYSYCHIMFA